MTLLWAVIVCFMTNLSAQDFEGIIEMVQITPTGIEYNMKWYIKDKKIAYKLYIRYVESLYDKDEDITNYVKKRIAEIKKEYFMKGESLK